MVVELEGTVHGELLDAVVEAVIRARGPAARAAVICELVQEMCGTLEWLHDGDPELDGSAVDELTSVRRLSRDARDHHRQMSTSRDLATAAIGSEPPRRPGSMASSKTSGRQPRARSVSRS